MKNFMFSLICGLSWMLLAISAQADEIALCDEWQQYCFNGPSGSLQVPLLAIALAKYDRCGNPGQPKDATKTQKFCEKEVKAVLIAWNEISNACRKCYSPDSLYPGCPGFKEEVPPPYLVCLPHIK